MKSFSRPGGASKLKGKVIRECKLSNMHPCFYTDWGAKWTIFLQVLGGLPQFIGLKTKGYIKVNEPRPSDTFSSCCVPLPQFPYSMDGELGLIAKKLCSRSSSSGTLMKAISIALLFSVRLNRRSSNHMCVYSVIWVELRFIDHKLS